ncbi:MAG TPA: metallophosphoesterase family protein [Candidatus Angelobacter sp.]|nr:metallophosphoesterase family protein [Candidatus Angelobacter sp.]
MGPVQILIVSDIHANLEALQSCLDAAPRFDRIFNLGDLVGYGANPNEVIERVRALGNVFVRGNHDKACAGVAAPEGFNPVASMAVLWTKKFLSPDSSEFLRTLPKGPIAPMDGVECVHGSARDEDEYILVARDAYPLLAETRTPVTFFGHTHIQGAFAMDEEKEHWNVMVPHYDSAVGLQRFTLHMKEKTRYLINPGSVGQPRDNDARAAFVLYDTAEGSITFYRVPYDIRTAQKKILHAGLPDKLAERLAEGR